MVLKHRCSGCARDSPALRENIVERPEIRRDDEVTWDVSAKAMMDVRRVQTVISLKQVEKTRECSRRQAARHYEKTRGWIP